MPEYLSVLLIGRIYEEDEVFKHIEKVITLLSYSVQTNVYFLDERTLLKVEARSILTMKHTTYHIFNRQKDQKIINYIITIGGDGTILYGAKQFLNQAPPIISFQRGTLGFMCRFQQEQIQEVIQEIVKHYICSSQLNTQKIKQKNMLPFPSTTIMRIKSIQTKKNQNGQKLEQIYKTCINQVCISRKQCERIILQIWINKQKITETAGDGILISTPTGSTAYSLSAGGPIMQNGVNSILITPIAPNSLSFRPICLPSDSEIWIKLSTKSRSQGYVSYDGQANVLFSQNDQIVITKSQHGITFLQPNDKMNKMPTWMQRLKFFLGWNEVFKYPQCKIRN